MVTAEYGGDVNFTQSASPAIVSLAVTPAQTAITVATAGSVSDALTLTTANGFTGTLQFSCTGLPTEATCAFSPSSVTLNGTGNPASTTLTVQTGVSASGGAPALFGAERRVALAGLVWVPCLLLLGFVPQARRVVGRGRLLMLALLLGGVCLGMTACGSSPRTPAGTSTVQVVASGPSGFTQTTSVTLTVQ